MLGNNVLAWIASFALALIWLRLNNFAAKRGWIGSDLSRKIIHIGTGPIFVLSWLLFTDTAEARWLAALIPLAITAQFVLIGLGVMGDADAVKSMSRSGDRRELLRGPLYYGIAFVIITLVFWKESPVGIIALMLLCGGDGLADIVGRRVPSLALPWSKGKTLAGSIAMFAGGLVFSVLVVGIYQAVGVFQSSLGSIIGSLTWIALLGALVESLPVSDLDNLSVPLAAVALGALLL